MIPTGIPILGVRQREGNVVYLGGWVTTRSCPVCGFLISKKRLASYRYLTNAHKCPQCKDGLFMDFQPLLFDGD